MAVGDEPRQGPYPLHQGGPVRVLRPDLALDRRHLPFLPVVPKSGIRRPDPPAPGSVPRVPSLEPGQDQSTRRLRLLCRPHSRRLARGRMVAPWGNHLCGLATAVGFGCHHRSGRTQLAEGVGFMKCIVVMLL